MHGEGVQLVAQGWTDGPALVSVGGGGEVNDAVLGGVQTVAGVRRQAGQSRHGQRVGQGETHRRSERLRHVHGGAGLSLVLRQTGLGAICSEEDRCQTPTGNQSNWGPCALNIVSLKKIQRHLLKSCVSLNQTTDLKQI